MSKRLVSDLPDDTLIEKVRFSTIIRIWRRIGNGQAHQGSNPGSDD